MHRLQCAEIWGGIEKEKTDIASPGIRASLFASSGAGAKGGDIYYLTLCNSTNITRMVIADIAGHGEIVSEISQSLFRSLKKYVDNLDGGNILADLNQVAIAKGIDAISTAAIATYYSHDGSFSFVYAGHPPILFKSRYKNGWQEARVRDEKVNKLVNIPLGVVSDASYLQDSVILKKNDRLIMYTDGLLETPSSNGEPFGMQRLLETLDKHGNKPLEELRDITISRLYEYAGNKLDHDDVTLLYIEIQ
ncbi:MAG: serine/threonine-protein phosphatase [Gammaproteobacteria bacterium]|nr:serine/threonine-protein phosphatase [Gammaproteobacteria bacterium]